MFVMTHGYMKSIIVGVLLNVHETCDTVSDKTSAPAYVARFISRTLLEMYQSPLSRQPTRHPSPQAATEMQAEGHSHVAEQADLDFALSDLVIFA